MCHLDRAHVVLLAGGKGERFWPRSTPEVPKQFLRIAGQKSLLRATYERAASFAPSSSIHVVTGARYADLTRSELPELPEDNLIFEPEGRDTAASLGLAALWLEQVDPNCIMIALPADHHIVGEGKFRATLEAAAAAAGEDRLVTLGVNPTRPETGYGYIQVGDVVGDYRGLPVHQALRFVEKPDLPTATRYLDSGDYLWNSGMFVWRASALRSEIARHLPALHSVLEELAAGGGLQSIRQQLPKVFSKAPKVSIDYGVMEKSDRVCVVPAYFGWDDVGNWAAVERMRPRDEQGNTLHGDVVAYDVRGVIVEGGHRLVAAVGVSDLIVVDTDEALLICSKARAQDVKQVAALAAPFTNMKVRPAVIPVQEDAWNETGWGRVATWAETEQYQARVLEVQAGLPLKLSDGGTTLILSGTGSLLSNGSWHTVGPGQVIQPGQGEQLLATVQMVCIEVTPRR